MIHSAWAVAARGHRVELCVQGSESASRILGALGLPTTPTLILRVLPSSNTLASVAYRLCFRAWLRRTWGRGVVLARNKRHAAWAQGLRPRPRVILEAHEIDSTTIAEQGGDPSTVRALEGAVLARAWGLVTNAGGTLAEIRRVHPRLPPAQVIHNGARPRLGPPPSDGEGIGCVGSVRPYKDPQTVARAAACLPHRITLVGPPREAIDNLQPLAAGRLGWEPPLDPVDVMDRLVRFRVLLLPLSPGRFGQHLTSPLKLWDALHSGVPLVAADTPAIREVADGAFVPYRPGDPEDLAAALDRAYRDPTVRDQVRQGARQRSRSWGDRARDLEAFADRVIP